jgi:hypothetical protein
MAEVQAGQDLQVLQVEVRLVEAVEQHQAVDMLGLQAAGPCWRNC